MLLNWGRSRGLVTVNSRTWVYQGCTGQLGVIRNTFTSSALTFNRSLIIIETGGKAYSSPRCFQLCWNAFVARLSRSNSGNLHFTQIYWNTLGDSSHLLKSWRFMEAQCPDIQTTRLVLCSKYDLSGHSKFPNLFGNGYHLPVLCTTTFIRHASALILWTWKWTDLRLNIFENVKSASLMAKISEHSYGPLTPGESMDPLLILSDDTSLKPFWKHPIM